MFRRRVGRTGRGSQANSNFGRTRSSQSIRVGRSGKGFGPFSKGPKGLFVPRPFRKEPRRRNKDFRKGTIAAHQRTSTVLGLRRAQNTYSDPATPRFRTHKWNNSQRRVTSARSRLLARSTTAMRSNVGRRREMSWRWTPIRHQKSVRSGEGPRETTGNTQREAPFQSQTVNRGAPLPRVVLEDQQGLRVYSRQRWRNKRREPTTNSSWIEERNRGSVEQDQQLTDDIIRLKDLANRLGISAKAYDQMDDIIKDTESRWEPNRLQRDGNMARAISEVAGEEVGEEEVNCEVDEDLAAVMEYEGDQ